MSRRFVLNGFLQLAMVGVAAVPLLSQSQPEKKPSFEVASVKPSAAAGNFIGIGRAPGGRFTANNVPLRFLIQNAYRVRDFQIIGAPSWMATDRWDIEARAEEGSVAPPAGPPDPNVPDGISLRLQSLLEDRFQLKLQREKRELPVYILTVVKGGHKMKAVDPPPRPVPGQAPPPPPPPPGAGRGGPPSNFTPPPGSISMAPGRLMAGAITMTQIVNTLSQLVGRTINDNTDLDGNFDVQLQFAPESAPANPAGGGGLVPPSGPGAPPPATDPMGPSIFTAIQEQLGLRLESSRGPVDVLVIESVQKPTEN